MSRRDDALMAEVQAAREGLSQEFKRLAGSAEAKIARIMSSAEGRAWNARFQTFAKEVFEDLTPGSEFREEAGLTDALARVNELRATAKGLADELEAL